MKAFEEWWEASGIKKRGGWGFKWLAKLVWRAALEWTISTCGKTEFGYPIQAIQRSVIEKELGED